MVGFLGGEVTLDGSTSQLSAGSASWDFNIDGSPETATFTVLDSTGIPLFTKTAPVSGGAGRFTWDGITDTGARAANGTYSLLINATSNNGTALDVTTETVGVVQGVDLSGGEPILLVDGREIRLEQIKSVNLPGTPAP
jgi:flagellar basal-body rod modification protein FlgD